MDEKIYDINGAAAYIGAKLGRSADRPYKPETVYYHIYESRLLKPHSFSAGKKTTLLYFTEQELDDFVAHLPKRGPKPGQRKPAS